MAKYDDLTKTDVYSSISTAELREIRRTLAKRANQRMVRLGRATSEITGEKYDEFGAVTKVKDYLERYGRTRFTESLTGETREYSAMSRERLQREIVVLQGFLNAKTSSVAGQRRAEEKRVATFTSQGLGRIAKNKEFYDFLNSNSYNALKSSAGLQSEQIQDLYQRASDEGMSAQEIQEAFDEYVSQADRVSVKGLREWLDARSLEED